MNCFVVTVVHKLGIKNEQLQALQEVMLAYFQN